MEGRKVATITIITNITTMIITEILLLPLLESLPLLLVLLSSDISLSTQTLILLEPRVNLKMPHAMRAKPSTLYTRV